MNPDDFEKRLQRQPLRQVPSEWRETILRRAMPPRPSPLAPRPSFLSSLLWPHPKAWAGLGAVWILIFALHFGSRDNSPQLAKNSASSSPEILVTFRDQQKLLVELMGNNETRELDKPKRFPAQPHSELRETTSTV